MKFRYFNRAVSVFLCALIVTSVSSVSFTADAAVLQDGYEDDYEVQGLSLIHI